MKFENEAKEIVGLVGGEANVASLVHCATRLRFELKDGSKFQKEKLEKLSYVLKVLVSGGQYQVVIGPNVDAYYDAIFAVAKIEGGNNTTLQSTEKVKLSDKILKVISGAFFTINSINGWFWYDKSIINFIHYDWCDVRF